MVEYQRKASSSVAKVATVLGGTALGLNLLGANGGNVLGLNGTGLNAPAITLQNNFVSEKEMCLIRENTVDKATIAQLTAEKYADAAIKVEVEPLKTRVCNLETAAAVNAARDQDFRRYVNAEFVHQPKAHINESIVVCEQCGCRRNDCGCC